ncbi:carbohydrate ABC transporter permease [soil metagenome]
MVTLALPRPVAQRNYTWLHLLLLIGSVVMLTPFAFMLLVSFWPKNAFMAHRYPLDQFTIQNYFEVFRQTPFGRYYLNSIIVSVSIVLLQLLTSSLAAFAFARLRFRGREVLFLLYLATLMIPFQVTMIPNYIMVARFLQWRDTYQALILPTAFSAFSTFLLRQYFKGIPLEMDEAARMDGANSFRIWWQIILPLSGAVLATLAIFNFQAAWNDFLWPLVITNKESMRTIPIGLASFQGQFSTEWHLLMAGSVIALLPVLIIYILGQNWFVRGITLSGMGGR